MNGDYIGYGHVQDMLDKANPSITQLPWVKKHHVIQEVIKLVNSYAEPEAATGKGE